MPVITGTSLVPWIVTVTSWLAVPSLDTAVKLSVIDWPAPSCWIAVWLSSARVGPVARRIEREACRRSPAAAGWRREGRLALIGIADARALPSVIRLPRPTAATSSVTDPLDVPVITGTSLVPWIVTVTSWLAVPLDA